MPGMPAEVIVGLDVGTTGVKAVAFGVDSSWRQIAIREYPLLQPMPGQEVQDPATLLTAIGDALTECLSAIGTSKVLAISVSAAMHGLIALDAQLHPLTPLITWADSRGSDQARDLRASGQAAHLQALTGAPVHPMAPLVKLMWFAENDRRTWTAARWWVGLKDYVLLWLTGQLVTELSSASGTGLLDMSTREWSPVAIDVCGVPPECLPPIRQPTSTLPVAPAVARQIGVPMNTPVVLGAGDGPLGNLGTGATARGVAGLSLGTSGAVRIAVDRPQLDAYGALFCYALTADVWVVGGAISNGGGVMRWAGKSLVPDVTDAAGGTGDAAVLKLASAAPAGCDGLVMLPYLFAERAPLWDLDLGGGYLGLRRDHTRAHLVRAALEGVCTQMRLILDRIDEVEKVRSVRVTGGVFRSPLWREVMAGMLARPLHVVDAAEGTAMGAAALGLFALGRVSELNDAAGLLADSGSEAPTVVEPAPELVTTYDRVRASIPELIGKLDGVAGLFRPEGG